MLVLNLQKIGNELYEIRRKRGLSRLEVAEMADISDRTYADIERGSVNMRIETVLRICVALNVTPDEVFIDKEEDFAEQKESLLSRLDNCSPKETETAIKLLSVYLDSINK